MTRDAHPRLQLGDGGAGDAGGGEGGGAAV